VLFEMKGTLGAVDERTTKHGESLMRIEDRQRADFHWLGGIVVTGLLVQVATIVTVLLRR
jgi:hypothetical protein